MRAAIFLFSVVANFAAAQECSCTDFGSDYRTVRPEDTDYMEDFPWEFVRCKPVYDLTQIEEPIVTYVVWVSLVTEDNPFLDTYILDPDMNEKILVGQEWQRYDDFENSLSPEKCSPLTS